jgi:hypothetical protein
MDTTHLAKQNTGASKGPEHSGLAAQTSKQPAAASSAPAQAAAPTAAAEPQQSDRSLSECVWWEDAACICEEEWGPHGRQADAAHPEI